MRFKNRRYGAWAGNKDGKPYDPKRCAAEVGDGFRFYQCLRKPVAGPDNLYCRQHAKLIADGRLVWERCELDATEE